MFEGSLVESTAFLQRRNRWPAIVSVAFQAAVAVALVSLPLLHPEALPLHAPALALVPPSPRPRPPVPPPQPVHVVATNNTAMAVPISTAPVIGTITISRNNPEPGPAGDVPNFNPVGIGPGDSGLPPSIVGVGSNTGPRVVRAAPASVARPNVSLGVSAGLLLAPIRPDYPAIAKATRTEGTVVVEAVISKRGEIESAHAVSGPMMLQGAALNAVRSARYRPYLLNGEPTEVQATFSINFRMSS
jgi:periplasmic protein TonB